MITWIGVLFNAVRPRGCSKSRISRPIILLAFLQLMKACVLQQSVAPLAETLVGHCRPCTGTGAIGSGLPSTYRVASAFRTGGLWGCR